MPRHWGWAATVKFFFGILYLMVISQVVSSNMSTGAKFLLTVMLVMASIDELMDIARLRLTYWEETRDYHLRRR